MGYAQESKLRIRMRAGNTIYVYIDQNRGHSRIREQNIEVREEITS